MNAKVAVDAMTVWNAHKPQYNGYGCGYGVHGKTKYSRKEKHKRDYKNYLDN